MKKIWCGIQLRPVFTSNRWWQAVLVAKQNKMYQAVNKEAVGKQNVNLSSSSQLEYSIKFNASIITWSFLFQNFFPFLWFLWSINFIVFCSLNTHQRRRDPRCLSNLASISSSTERKESFSIPIETFLFLTYEKNSG